MTVQLKNLTTGSLVEVSEATAARLDRREWVPVQGAAPKPPAPSEAPSRVPSGSSTKAEWYDYARSLGIDVEPGTTRAQVMKAVRELKASDV